MIKQTYSNIWQTVVMVLVSLVDVWYKTTWNWLQQLANNRPKFRKELVSIPPSLQRKPNFRFRSLLYFLSFFAARISALVTPPLAFLSPLFSFFFLPLSRITDSTAGKLFILDDGDNTFVIFHAISFDSHEKSVSFIQHNLAATQPLCSLYDAEL